MFDQNFSFSASRSSSVDSNHTDSSINLSRSISPCSAMAPVAPPSQPSIADLAAQLADSRLRTESRIRYDSCDAYANHDDDAGWQLDPMEAASDDCIPAVRSSQPHLHQPHSSSQRSSRQSNARLLCSASYRHDIAALVTRMVHAQDQCSVATTSTPDDDEGYDSCGQAPSSRRASLASQKHMLEYRRSSDIRSTTGACVHKTTRFRKDRHHSRQRTTER